MMIRKILSVITAFAVILAVPVFTRAADSADAATSATIPNPEPTAPPAVQEPAPAVNTTYTLEEMLIKAMQEKYKAQALYNAAITTLGAGEPFTFYFQEESDLIGLLELTLTEHGIPLPENNATILEDEDIASLRRACLVLIKAEKKSIEMYKSFLAQNSLPDDVKELFQLLLAASRDHLSALNTLAVGEGWLSSTPNAAVIDDDDDEPDVDDDDGYNDEEEYEDDEDGSDEDEEDSGDDEDDVEYDEVEAGDQEDGTEEDEDDSQEDEDDSEEDDSQDDEDGAEDHEDEPGDDD